MLRLLPVLIITTLCCPALLVAQFEARPPDVGAGGPGRGFGPPLKQETKLVAQFDRDGNQRLDAEERQAAREFQKTNRASGRGGRGGRGPGRASESSPPVPGARLTGDDVARHGSEPLYDPNTLRTLFLKFENADWERELEDFHDTDVDVPATLTVDGKIHREVGVHFRGASSYMMVGTGYKRSLNLSLDHAYDDQNLLGFRTLNLLNSHEDASFLRAPLFSHIAQHYIPTPRVNFVRVVIGGENWGVYASAEQFNKDFLKSRYGSSKGARWKVPGGPMGRGGLAYLGENASAYRGSYEIKSKDDAASWAKLIRVCRLLDQTPPDQLEAALLPHLDVDGALQFLALDVTLVNGDGFWTRTSDYSIGEDDKGRLHLVPHDMNETFSAGGGPGGGPRGGRPPSGERARVSSGGLALVPGEPGGPPPSRTGSGGRGGPGAPRGPGGTELDPLAAAANPNAALASKLLAVPALRARYLGYVRDIATTWLDWSVLGPVAQSYHDLIDAEVRRDTRKLVSYEAFAASLTGDPRSLKAFAEKRRAFLLNHPAIKLLANDSTTK